MENDWGWVEDIIPLKIEPYKQYLIDCTVEGFDQEVVKTKLIELFGYKHYYDEVNSNFNWFNNNLMGDDVYLYLTVEGQLVSGGWDTPDRDITDYMRRGVYMTISDFLTTYYNG